MRPATMEIRARRQAAGSRVGDTREGRLRSLPGMVMSGETVRCFRKSAIYADVAIGHESRSGT